MTLAQVDPEDLFLSPLWSNLLIPLDNIMLDRNTITMGIYPMLRLDSYEIPRVIFLQV